MRGLEIGGGPHPQRGDFEQFDAIDWHERTGLVYTLGDARALPYRDHSFDVVYASNVLEHFPPLETTAVLREWMRVVRLTGWLELVVPDSMGILKDFFAGINPWDDCAERLRGSRDYPGNEHFACFTLSTFHLEVERAGLFLQSVESSNAGGGIHAIVCREGEVVLTR